MRRAALVACVAPILLGASAPADPQADAKTRDVLFYLGHVVERRDHRIVFGQLAGAARCCGPGEYGAAAFEKNLTRLKALTGRTPGMIGLDYNDSDSVTPGAPVSFDELNRLARPYAEAGALITIGYHAKNPWTGGFWNQGGCPGAFADLIDLGKPVGRAWRRQLDAVAQGLRQWRDWGVPVLWRPFLEANSASNSWWQVCRPSPEAFRAVWRDMFGYLTHEKGLHNLLWVYAPVTAVGPNRPALELYPGGDLVDVAGYDSYHDNADWPDYAAWARLGKALAYPERGPHTTDGASALYVNFLDGIAAHGWRVAYVQTWFGPYNPLDNPGGVAMIRDPAMADQSDVGKALACLAAREDARGRLACVVAP